ncbi:Plasmodium exported protein, unknown function [Plasmodium relictum]|uniref:Plasmodium RESA N-terminal domain-containing protein n=1 Tax=Plasmodium relictum TaxID=85471 RepID=A0A1J1GKB6_PLARL|nr:Plasmodium exported protein, unknown function [Plasmodium relictum]CRG84778.1 Plasmodium exported protein, unknown function [Plasmodium relictum]
MHLLTSSSMVIKNNSKYLHESESEITKKRSCNIPILFKLLFVLFLTLLCFLIECLFKQENLSISSVEFNKDHLRILTEEEREYKNKLLYVDKLHDKYIKRFKDIKHLITGQAFSRWEHMCYLNRIRYSLNGRIWEQKKFNYWYNKFHNEIQNIYDKAIEKYEEHKKSYLSDREYSILFNIKVKELENFESSSYRWFTKYLKECEKEWIHLKYPRKLSKCSPSIHENKEEKCDRLIKNIKNLIKYLIRKI